MINKKYEIKRPTKDYIQVIALFLLFFINVYAILRLQNINQLLVILQIILLIFLFAVIVFSMINILRSSKEIEITSNSLKTKHIELPLENIDKIIIDGYFMQSIGIKQKGKKLVSANLHFKFKHNNESLISEWVQWAEKNGIEVVKGRIVRWI